MNNGYKKIVIEKLIAVGTEQAKDRLGNFNSLRAICLKKGLSPDEFIVVSEGVLRNVMKICDSGLKNSFANKRRYKEEMAKASALALRTDKNETESLPWTMPGSC